MVGVIEQDHPLDVLLLRLEGLVDDRPNGMARLRGRDGALGPGKLHGGIEDLAPRGTDFATPEPDRAER